MQQEAEGPLARAVAQKQELQELQELQAEEERLKTREQILLDEATLEVQTLLAELLKG